MALPAAAAADASTVSRLSTVVTLWRQAAEFAVDVVDAGGADCPQHGAAGHLDVVVRRVPVVGGKSLRGSDSACVATKAEDNDATTAPEPETVRVRCEKEQYWRFAMSDEDRVLRRMHAAWLARRLETIIEDDLVDTREEGKVMALADLKRELADRRKRHSEWRNLGSERARANAWHRSVEESARDQKNYSQTVHDIMMDDVAHRWLSINLESEGKSIRNMTRSGHSFTAVIKPPGPHRPKGSNYNQQVSLHREGTKNKGIEANKKTRYQSSFVALGPNGFADRDKRFSSINDSLRKDLKSVDTRTHQGAAHSQMATTMIDRACLTEEELEAKRQAEYARIEQLRRLEGMSDEELFIDFLCSVNQSKQEAKLTEAGVGWRELPGLTDQKLLNILNMRNMLARRRFLQAIEERFGEERVRRVQSGGRYETDDEADVDVEAEEGRVKEDEKQQKEPNRIQHHTKRLIQTRT